MARTATQTDLAPGVEVAPGAESLTDSRSAGVPLAFDASRSRAAGVPEIGARLVRDLELLADLLHRHPPGELDLRLPEHPQDLLGAVTPLRHVVFLLRPGPGYEIRPGPVLRGKVTRLARRGSPACSCCHPPRSGGDALSRYIAVKRKQSWDTAPLRNPAASLGESPIRTAAAIRASSRTVATPHWAEHSDTSRRSGSPRLPTETIPIEWEAVIALARSRPRLALISVYSLCIAACSSTATVTSATDWGRIDFDSAWAEIGAHAARGDARSARQMGIAWRDGIGVPRSPERSADWFRIAADRGDEYSHVALAQLVCDEPQIAVRAGLSRDQAVSSIISAADIRNPYALECAALLVINDRVPPNRREHLLQLVKELAEKGNAVCAFAIATSATASPGLGIDTSALTERLLVEAAESGYAPAQLALARRAHPPGDNVTSKSAAREWLECIVETAFQVPPERAPGDDAASLIEVALLELARSYLSGSPSAKDVDQATAYLRRAIAYGSRTANRAMFDLHFAEDAGLIMSHASQNDRKDWTRAKYEMYTRRADAGDVEAAYMLGLLLIQDYRDLGLQEHISALEALDRLRRAADAGHSEAGFALAQLLMNEDETAGVMSNHDEAYRLLRTTALGGHAGAALALAEWFCDSDEGRSEASLRSKWLLVACDLAPPYTTEWAMAHHKLGEYYATRSSGPSCERLALHEFRLAAHGKSIDAAFRLGEFHECGRGGAVRDAAIAAAWYEEAARRGSHVAAMRRLAELYAEGRGVARDPVESQYWAGCAAAQE